MAKADRYPDLVEPEGGGGPDQVAHQMVVREQVTASDGGEPASTNLAMPEHAVAQSAEKNRPDSTQTGEKQPHSIINLVPKDPNRISITKAGETAACQSDTSDGLGEALSGLMDCYEDEDNRSPLSTADKEGIGTGRRRALPNTLARTAGTEQASPIIKRITGAQAARRSRNMPGAASKNVGMARSATAESIDRGDEKRDEWIGPKGTVWIEQLHPNRHQPRRRFDEDQIGTLAESLKAHGILQPILVRPDPDQAGEFEILAGERRWRAAKLAGLHEIPVVVRTVSDRGALEVALIENVQRVDLTALEKAEGYSRLINDFGHTHESVARILCTSRSQVSNTLRLLNLPLAVMEMLQEGRLSGGHARALLGAKRPEELARRVISKGLSVRQTELLARWEESARPPKRFVRSARDAEIAALEHDLATLLGLKVTISPRGRGGSVTIHYTDPEQLADIVRHLSPMRGNRPQLPSPRRSRLP